MRVVLLVIVLVTRIASRLCRAPTHHCSAALSQSSWVQMRALSLVIMHSLRLTHHVCALHVFSISCLHVFFYLFYLMTVLRMLSFPVISLRAMASLRFLLCLDGAMQGMLCLRRCCACLWRMFFCAFRSWLCWTGAGRCPFEYKDRKEK